MKITKRDLLRIIAEEASAINTEKVLEEGKTVEDINARVDAAIKEFVAQNGREPSMKDINKIIVMAMEHNDEDLVQDTGPGPLQGEEALQWRRYIDGTGYLNQSDDASGPSLKESIRKLVRKHTKAPERLALEESIRRSLHTVLTQD